MPKVSVILTSFNHAKYIRAAIDSVLGQTFADFELIILDDASTDNSWWLISQYSDVRIKAFRTDVSGEVVARMNNAISHIASGAYVAIHHSDDVWEPEKLSKQVQYLDEHEEVGAVFTRAQAISEDGGALADDTHPYLAIFDQPNRSRQQWVRYFFDHGNALCHPSVLIRKHCYETCGLYRPVFWQLCDFEMWIRLTMRYPIHVIQQKLVRFRVRDNEANMSGNTGPARIRGTYEHHALLDNYRGIASLSELLQIFPEAEKHYRGDEADVLFLLGRTILEITPSPLAGLFALELLREAIIDPSRRNRAKADYGFDERAFIACTGRYDVFSLEEVRALSQRLGERDERVGVLDRAVAESEDALLSIRQRLALRDERVALLDRAVFDNQERILTVRQQLAESEASIRESADLLTRRDKQLDDLRSSHFQHEQKIETLDRALSDQTGKLASLHLTLADRDVEVITLNEVLSRRDSEMVATSAILIQKESENATLVQNASVRESELVALRQSVSARDGELLSVQQKLSARDGERARLAEVVGQLQQELVQFDLVLKNRDQAISAILGSSSWRLTWPWRFLGRLCRGKFEEAFAPMRRGR